MSAFVIVAPTAKKPLSAYVIATQPGSLPKGGTVQDTPVFALRRLPDGLIDAVPAKEPARRTDIEIEGQLAFLVENVMSKEACQALIEIGDHLGFREEAPGISTPPGMRMNLALHWMADAGLMEKINDAIAPLMPQQLHGKALWPRLSQRIDMYKYCKGDVFNRHIDGTWPGYGFSMDRVGIDEWVGAGSELSMLLYLNGAEDGIEGGETRLYGRGGTVVDVSPKAGSALFFQHGFVPSSVMHAGTRVTGDKAKYVARINVLYALD